MKLDPPDTEAPPEPPQPRSGARRHWLLGAAGAAAAVAGGAIAWWGGGTGAPVVQEPLDTGFWDMSWESPKGTIVHASQLRQRPLVINFWATWCAPCIEELPLLNAFYRQYRSHGWQVLGLAIDRLSAVQHFLERNPVDFQVGMAGLAGTELARSLGNVSGGLPFTVVVGAAGGVAQRKLGRLHSSDIERWPALQ